VGFGPRDASVERVAQRKLKESGELPVFDAISEASGDAVQLVVGHSRDIGTERGVSGSRAQSCQSAACESGSG
jgi:hypothetical protein